MASTCAAAVELGGFRCRAVGFGMGRYRHQPAPRRPGGRGLSAAAQPVERHGHPADGAASGGPDAIRPESARPDPRRCRPAPPRAARGWSISAAAACRSRPSPAWPQAASRCWWWWPTCERRATMLAGPLHPGRFGRRHDRAGQLLRGGGAGAGRGAVRRVVALDPPADPEQGAVLAELGSLTTVHLVWGAAEIEFARGGRGGRAAAPGAGHGLARRHAPAPASRWPTTRSSAAEPCWTSSGWRPSRRRRARST